MIMFRKWAMTVWNQAASQHCDSFLCLKNFHDQMLIAQDNHTLACRVAEEYVTCVSQATDPCISLELDLQLEAAVRMKNMSFCTSLTPDLSGNGTALSSRIQLVIATLTFVMCLYHNLA